MVSFLYTTDYDETGIDNSAVSGQREEELPAPRSALELHAGVFSLGEKYGIKGLCELSTDKYERRLRDCSNLEFLNSVPGVYQLTAASVRSLRDVVKRFARGALENCTVQNSKNEAREVYERIASEVPDFVKDCLDAYIDNSHRCRKCRCRYSY